MIIFVSELVSESLLQAHTFFFIMYHVIKIIYVTILFMKIIQLLKMP